MQARSAFVNRDEGRADSCGIGLGFGCVLCALTTCLSAAQRARKQFGAPSLLRVESTVCFQRKRGLPSSIKTKAGQVSMVVL